MSDQNGGNGSGTRMFLSLAKIPIAVWGVLITQFMGLILWAVRLDNRVEGNEKLIREMMQEDTIPGRLLTQRLNQNDERLRYLVNYALFLREELHRVAPNSGANAPPLMPPAMQAPTPAPTPAPKPSDTPTTVKP